MERAERRRPMGQEVSVELPAGLTPILSVVPMPSDSNQHGDIFGGWLMSQVDIAGGVAAARRARGRVATVAVNSFIFKPTNELTSSESVNYGRSLLRFVSCSWKTCDAQRAAL